MPKGRTVHHGECIGRDDKHTSRFAASIATSVSYGRRVESIDEWIVKENMAAMDCESCFDGIGGGDSRSASRI